MGVDADFLKPNVIPAKAGIQTPIKLSGDGRLDYVPRLKM
jgi:hypothetical protein